MSIYMVVIPVLVSPFIIAQLIGAAPLYFGSREACTLIQPKTGMSKTALLKICPYATTIIKSGLISTKALIVSSLFSLLG